MAALRTLLPFNYKWLNGCFWHTGDLLTRDDEGLIIGHPALPLLSSKYPCGYETLFLSLDTDTANAWVRVWYFIFHSAIFELNPTVCVLNRYETILLAHTAISKASCNIHLSNQSPFNYFFRWRVGRNLWYKESLSLSLKVKQLQGTVNVHSFIYQC